MKEHFYQTSSLPLQKNQSKKTNKQQMKAQIHSLIKRRQYHEARIEKLIGKNYRSGDATKQSPKSLPSEFSQILQQLDNNQPAWADRVHQSVAFGSHVNLLATVTLKTQYYLTEKAQIRQLGQLQPSLNQLFGKTKVITSFDNTEELEGISETLKQIADYLKEVELSQEIFRRDNTNQYNTTRFHLGKYQEIHLSKEPLKEEEQSFLIVQQDQNDKVVNIGWLLLSRLLKETKCTTFPRALHTLFSYPLKTFYIRESLQLIELNELMGELTKSQDQKQSQKQTVKIFGIDEKSGYSYQISNLSKSKNLKYYTPILNRFSKLVLINEQELPVKHIPLSCLQNHFVILTMNISTKGQYYISVGCPNYNRAFRVYIIDYEGNVVYGQIINSGEFIFCKLKEEQYQIYIHPIPQTEFPIKDMEESYELVKEQQENFSLWVQGKQIYSKNSELSLQIRLKEEYNHYTMKITQNYLLSTNINNNPQLGQTLQGNVIIKRQILSKLGLFVDTFLFSQDTTIIATYKGSYMLADQLFQQSQAIISSGQSLVLYNQAEITTLKVQKKGHLENIEFKLIQFYA